MTDRKLEPVPELSTEEKDLFSKESAYHYIVLYWETDASFKTRYLFRGASTLPDKVYSEGFHSRGNNPDLFSHVQGILKDSRFISTSTSKDAAAQFPQSSKKMGFLYQINPQKNAIDIIKNLAPETFKDSSPVMKRIISTEKEIAIPLRIDPSDIKGAWPVETYDMGDEKFKIVRDDIFIENSNYKPPRTERLFTRMQTGVKVAGGVGIASAVALNGYELYKTFKVCQASDNHRPFFEKSFETLTRFGSSLGAGAFVGGRSALICLPFGPWVSLGCGLSGGLLGSISGDLGGSLLARRFIDRTKKLDMDISFWSRVENFLSRLSFVSEAHAAESEIAKDLDLSDTSIQEQAAMLDAEALIIQEAAASQEKNQPIPPEVQDLFKQSFSSYLSSCGLKLNHPTQSENLSQLQDYFFSTDPVQTLPPELNEALTELKGKLQFLEKKINAQLLSQHEAERKQNFMLIGKNLARSFETFSYLSGSSDMRIAGSIVSYGVSILSSCDLLYSTSPLATPLAVSSLLSTGLSIIASLKNPKRGVSEIETIMLQFSRVIAELENIKLSIQDCKEEIKAQMKSHLEQMISYFTNTHHQIHYFQEKFTYFQVTTDANFKSVLAGQSRLAALLSLDYFSSEIRELEDLKSAQLAVVQGIEYPNETQISLTGIWLAVKSAKNQVNGVDAFNRSQLMGTETLRRALNDPSSHDFPELLRLASAHLLKQNLRLINTINPALWLTAAECYISLISHYPEPLEKHHPIAALKCGIEKALEYLALHHTISRINQEQQIPALLQLFAQRLTQFTSMLTPLIQAHIKEEIMLMATNEPVYQAKLQEVNARVEDRYREVNRKILSRLHSARATHGWRYPHETETINLTKESKKQTEILRLQFEGLRRGEFELSGNIPELISSHAFPQLVLPAAANSGLIAFIDPVSIIDRLFRDNPHRDIWSRAHMLGIIAFECEYQPIEIKTLETYTHHVHCGSSVNVYNRKRQSVEELTIKVVMKVGETQILPIGEYTLALQTYILNTAQSNSREGDCSHKAHANPHILNFNIETTPISGTYSYSVDGTQVSHLTTIEEDMLIPSFSNWILEQHDFANLQTIKSTLNVCFEFEKFEVFLNAENQKIYSEWLKRKTLSLTHQDPLSDEYHMVHHDLSAIYESIQLSYTALVQMIKTSLAEGQALIENLETQTYHLADTLPEQLSLDPLMCFRHLLTFNKTKLLELIKAQPLLETSTRLDAIRLKIKNLAQLGLDLLGNETEDEAKHFFAYAEQAGVTLGTPLKHTPVDETTLSSLPAENRGIVPYHPTSYGKDDSISWLAPVIPIGQRIIRIPSFMQMMQVIQRQQDIINHFLLTSGAGTDIEGRRIEDKPHVYNPRLFRKRAGMPQLEDYLGPKP